MVFMEGLQPRICVWVGQYMQNSLLRDHVMTRRDVPPVYRSWTHVGCWAILQHSYGVRGQASSTADNMHRDAQKMIQLLEMHYVIQEITDHIIWMTMPGPDGGPPAEPIPIDRFNRVEEAIFMWRDVRVGSVPLFKWEIPRRLELPWNPLETYFYALMHRTSNDTVPRFVPS